ncbi:DNA-binding protein inhibitor ID-1 [Trichinella patagoniensis]|uniref:DNA-binding protein inhibitor ID-1 n=1 Tax=Trichinella patagoniensis TaxID=990121 RepID=A0A0V1A6R6_9BILA|nr:DNA-binding protein inhibitor ID-1 [Trichinella patagoniensis]
MSQAAVSDDPVNPVDISSPSLKRSAEAVATLNQLKQLVPSLRSRRNASDDLEFLQHIIDYIHDLQKQLNSDNNVKSQQPNSGLASQNH